MAINRQATDAYAERLRKPAFNDSAMAGEMISAILASLLRGTVRTTIVARHETPLQGATRS